MSDARRGLKLWPESHTGLFTPSLAELFTHTKDSGKEFTEAHSQGQVGDLVKVKPGSLEHFKGVGVNLRRRRNHGSHQRTPMVQEEDATAAQEQSWEGRLSTEGGQFRTGHSSNLA